MSIKMTKELNEKVVRHWLTEKGEPWGSGPCGCMGPQPIGAVVENQIKITATTDRIGTIKRLRQLYNCTSIEAARRLDSNPIINLDDFIHLYTTEQMLNFLAMGGATAEVQETKYEPFCYCDMKMVIMYDGHYFKIHRNSVDLGVQYSSTYVGPVGGPYMI